MLQTDSLHSHENGADIDENSSDILGPLLTRLGLIADIQYCDRDVAWNLRKTAQRYYRETLSHLRNAVDSWTSISEDKTLCTEISAVVQLGDIIDGWCHHDKNTDECLKKVLNIFEKLGPIPHISVIGNHELYNFTRNQLWNASICAPLVEQARVNGPKTNDAMYYSYKPCPGYRIVVIDVYDVSILGWDSTDSQGYRKGYETLAHWNPNENKNISLGMERTYIVGYNGGVSDDQLTWIRRELTDCEKMGDRVIIASHIPLIPEVSVHKDVPWNVEDLTDVMDRFKGTVVAVLAGHCHFSAWKVDHRGILHFTSPGIVEVPPGRNGFATLELYRHGLVISATDFTPRVTHLCSD